MDVHDALVRRVWQETPRLSGVVLEVTSELAAQHVRPGQVISVVPPADSGRPPAFFALANNPGEARALQLLVDVGYAPVIPKPGDTLQISAPSGPGFDLELAEGKDVYVMGQGSAIAALRPVVEGLRRRRNLVKSLRVYFTARDAYDFAFVQEYASWRADGISVTQVVGRPYMQERLAQLKPDLATAVAYVCGSPEMMDDVSSRLVALGLAPDAIYRNW